MIEIIKGKYKNISMRIDADGNIVVKAPKKTGDEIIYNFINSHKRWIDKQLQKKMNEKILKGSFDFENYVYHFGEKILFDKSDKEKILFYHNAVNEVKEMVKNLSIETNLSFNSLKITNSKRNWGSLDQKKNMKLNLKLVILRRELVNYVILHELCHGVEFNHYKRFWELVQKHCSNYKELREELKQYGFLLTTNII